MTLKIALTGGHGFLGWHVRVLAASRGAEVRLLDRKTVADPAALRRVLDGCDRVVHLAGVNRGTDTAVSEGNTQPAENLARALVECSEPPLVVFANSIQSLAPGVYGAAKARAAVTLRRATERAGSGLVDVLLPNLFGEHGRPFYNSVVATFCHLLATGGTPEIHQDRSVELLHAGEASALLLDAAPGEFVATAGAVLTVREIWARLANICEMYSRGDIPEIPDRFSLDLFNTYRSFCAPQREGFGLPLHKDHRGGLVEVVKAHGGTGQTFFSTSVPGVTRGQHYHLRKVERFVVVEGEAVISLRRMFSSEVVTCRVAGELPVAVDMPTMWAHKITNTGPRPLLTIFWTNDVFNPKCPDTYLEQV